MLSFIVVVVIFLTFYNLKYYRESINDKYILIEHTRSINGLFVLWVFLSHVKQYVILDIYDILYMTMDRILGQMIVVTFLFYSGFGIMLSIMQRENYLQKIPRRLLKIWCHFAICLVLFLIINTILGHTYDKRTVLLSFIGYESIGNSCWYMFAIFVLYIFTFLAFNICGNNYIFGVILVAFLSSVYCVTLHIAGKGDYYYNTIFSFVGGMTYALCRKNFEIWISNCLPIERIKIVLIMLLLWICSFILRDKFILLYEINSLIFCFLVLFVTMKFLIGNGITNWLGKYTFEIYILQRIPMILFSSIEGGKFLIIYGSLFMTVLLSVILKKLEYKWDMIFEKIVCRRGRT